MPSRGRTRPPRSGNRCDRPTTTPDGLKKLIRDLRESPDSRHVNVTTTIDVVVRGVTTGRTGVDLSTPLLPEGVPVIDADPLSFYRGGGRSGPLNDLDSLIITGLMKKALRETQTLRAKNFRSATDPLPEGAGPPKFNQLEMVTTCTYRPSLVKIDARNFELSW